MSSSQSDLNLTQSTGFDAFKQISSTSYNYFHIFIFNKDQDPLSVFFCGIVHQSVSEVKAFWVLRSKNRNALVQFTQDLNIQN